MATRIKLRRDTAANWLTANPILAQGETGFETDTRMMKLGNGSTRWADLKYAVTGDLKVTGDTIHGDTSVSLSSGVGNSENWILLTQANTDNDISQPASAHTTGVAYDSLGNAYAMGWYDVAPFGTGCYLQKISPSGEVLFNQYYNEYESYGFGLTVDKDDNVIMILGESDSPSNDILLVKVSGEDGSIMWQKYINSLGDYDDYATCIDVNLNGDIFIAGSTQGEGDDCLIAKFNGVNGNLMWSKRYDAVANEGFDDTGTGLTVDPDGNLGVVGSTSWMDNFLNIYKVNGTTGDIMWEGKILDVSYSNGNNNGSGSVESADICADTAGNFYVNIVVDNDTSFITKFNGSTGVSMWARQIGWDDYRTGTGSVICDDQNNVYVSSTLIKYKPNYEESNTYRPTQQITKFNATGSVIWQRWLSNEQAETFDAGFERGWDWGDSWNGQSIRIFGDYVLVGGEYILQSDYDEDNQDWYVQPYVAQLNRDGTEFNVNGWKFEASDIEINFVTIYTDPINWEFDPAGVANADLVITGGDVSAELNTDTTALVYVNTSRVNKVTLEGKALTLPAGGTVELSREKLGYITAIGSFDGNEGGNTNGNVWLNGSARDEKGATYAAGGWYSDNTWNDESSGVDVQLVFKTDANGKLLWQAGNALNQWGDLVDVVYNQNSSTVVVLGNDGELDGNEGFNVMYLDADTGSMKQNITHIRPGDNDNDIYPTSLRLLSDGTPVVVGYIDSFGDTYPDVTSGAAGLPGSTDNGTLVVAKTAFVRPGFTPTYPSEDGNWYLEGSQITSVNRFGYDDSSLDPVYSGTTGTNATVDVAISNTGATLVTSINAGGTGYKPGQRLVVLGTNLGGTSPANDLYLYIDTVDGSGAITAFASNGDFDSSAPGDGTYTAVTTTSPAGTMFSGWAQYSATATTYTFNIYAGGNYYGVGDTFTVSGALLGGTTSTNDLTITVTAINGTGYGAGQITEVSTTGTAQNGTVKLYVGNGDFTTSGAWEVVHELNDDGFIWTPTWNVTFGNASGNNSYDHFHGVTVDSDDNIIVSGYVEDTGLENSYYGNDQTGVIMKFSSTGTQHWAVSIDGNEGSSTVWGVATDSDNNVYSVMSNGANSQDPYITKLTADGEFVWQQRINTQNGGSWSIDITNEGDIIIAGENYLGLLSNDYYHYNNNIIIVKLDKDGNKLFSRVLWSPNGVQTNYNDDYSNQLTVKGDRFSFVAHSDDPGDDSYQGIVIDLPTDGTGLGQYGNFIYEECEINIDYRSNENNWNGTQLVTPFTPTIRPHDFISAPYEDSEQYKNVTVYADRDHQIQTVRKAGGAEVKGVAKITFEDGSEQTTSMQGLPQVEISRMSAGDYWLRPEDNGKHILMKWSNTVIIPDPSRQSLPIGYSVTIVNGNWNGDCGVWSEDDEEDIYAAGQDGTNDYSWSIPQWTVATLIKIENGRWMIIGNGLNTGWW